MPLIDQLLATPPAEAIAALLGLAYLLLAVRRNLLCWLCAFVSTAIYLVLFLQVPLYMHSALQVFYLVMAIVGFRNWRQGRTEEAGVLIRTWTLSQHALAAVAVLAGTAINGWMLATYTQTPAPYLDAFVTWGSVVTTWMVARRVLENWLYWIVVDGFAAYLYFSQGLFATTLLFVIYLGIVVRGHMVWLREYRGQSKERQLMESANVAG
jgi:nicotinamide mononucleotide transporter